MQPPADLLSRILGKSRYFTLHYGEPAREPRTIELLHALEQKEYRRLDKRIRQESFPAAKPVLVLNCNLRFPADMGSDGLRRFLLGVEQPTFSHRTCYATAEMNRDIHRRLAGPLDRLGGLVAYVHGTGACVYYPVRQGDRLTVAYFAV